jgi:hypothetical protein
MTVATHIQFDGDGDGPDQDRQSDAHKAGKKRGGGPRTAEGKARSSQNAVKHGILSNNPVATGESLEDWEVHVAGMHEQFDPRGSYEELCVQHIAEDLWRLGRLTRQETALISLRVGEVDPPTGPSFLKAPRPFTESLPKAKWPLEAISVLQMLEIGFHRDDYDLGDGVMADCELAICVGSGLGGLWTPPPRVAGDNTVGYLRRLLNAASEASGKSVEDLEVLAVDVLETLVGFEREKESKIADARKSVKAKARRAARAHLPADDDLDRLLRYKRGVERSLDGWLKKLDAAQKARLAGAHPDASLNRVLSS